VGSFTDNADDVMAWYDAIAPSYDELYGDEQLRKYKRIFTVLESLDSIICRGNCTVIDIGCGTALMAEELSKLPFVRTHYYVGIDLSLNILEIARKRVGNLEAIADLIAGDAANLPLRDGIADVIFSISVFRCGDPVNRLIKEALRLCKAPGVVAFTVVCGKGVERTACHRNWNLFYEDVIRNGRELIRIIKCQQFKKD